MSEARRAGWPVLVVLLFLLAGSSYVAWRTYQDYLDVGREAPRAPVPEPDAPDEPDTWRHHAWVVDAGAPPAGAIPTVPPEMQQEAHDELYDPQRWAMRRELRLFGDAGAALPFEPWEREARIARLEGELPFGPDASCTARVLPARSGRFNCLVRVVCDGHVVYPNPTQTAGYVECELDEAGQPRRAHDVGHTAVDGDPRIDLRASGAIVVSDAGDGVREFTLTLRAGG